MTEYDEESFERKLEHIRKNYDRHISGYRSQRQYTIIIRGWCITLIMAYIGYCVSNDNILAIPFFPVLLILIVFFTLEGFFKLNCWEIRKHIRQIDKLFMTKDKQEFRKDVSVYKFSSLPNEKHDNSWKKLGYEIGEYYKATKNDRHSILWYLLLGIVFYLVCYRFA